MAVRSNFLMKLKGWFSFKTPVWKWVKAFGLKKKDATLKLPAPDVSEEREVLKQNQTHPCSDYMNLKMYFRDVGRMNAVIETLGRDFLTAMPDGAYKSRLGQIAFLARRMHEDLANKKVAALIEKSHAHEKKRPDDWDNWDSSNLYEMEMMYRHHCQVDPDLMEKRAKLSYEGRRRHLDVLKNNDWDSAKGFLQEMIDLQREIAESKCLLDNEHETDAPYQALMREYIPGARLSDIDSLFGDFEGEVKALLPRIMEAQNKQDAPIPLDGSFPAQLQLWLNKSLLKLIGFDFNRGGLYETGHNPVEGGTPDDTRLVIKTSNTTEFMQSMKSTLHEGGHGLYIQGLPRTQWRYQPVGQDLGAAVHESQALLIDMILCRKKEFFEYLSPRVEGLFQRFGDPAMSADNLYKLRNWVGKTVNRRSADEVTYFLHILLRIRLERDLIAGRLKVKDLPDAWNAGMKETFGIEPKTYAEGCLQDVHWFVGKFGYFPAYTLGHMMAAQMHDSMKKDLQNIPELVQNGEFGAIREWIGTHIHAKGRLNRTDALIEDVTGAPLSINPLVNHLKERYLQAA